MMFDKEKRMPYKCELCGGEDPACASICPTGSIVFVRQKAFRSQPAALQMKGFALLRERNKKNTEARKRASGADPGRSMKEESE
jgi:Fe-S-cluster-containing dehydrogenase component